MKSLFARFVKDESGATAIEYGLIAAGISVAIITVVKNVGTQLNPLLTSIQNAPPVSRVRSVRKGSALRRSLFRLRARCSCPDAPRPVRRESCTRTRQRSGPVHVPFFRFANPLCFGPRLPTR